MAELGSSKVLGNLIVTGNIIAHDIKPLAPIAFDVTTATQFSATNKIVFNTIYVNAGNCYNASTGRFTAPVKGTYVFHTATIKNSSNSTIVRLKIYKNGVATNGGREKRLAELTGYGENSIGTWVLNLEQNDYIEVWITEGTTYNTTDYLFFNGFLLS